MQFCSDIDIFCKLQNADVCLGGMLWILLWIVRLCYPQYGSQFYYLVVWLSVHGLVFVFPPHPAGYSPLDHSAYPGVSTVECHWNGEVNCVGRSSVGKHCVTCNRGGLG